MKRLSSLLESQMDNSDVKTIYMLLMLCALAKRPCDTIDTLETLSTLLGHASIDDYMSSLMLSDPMTYDSVFRCLND